MTKNTIGNWSFIIGVVVAIIAGLFGTDVIPYTALILVVLGLVVGFINVNVKQTSDFLIAAIALLVASTSIGALSVITMLGDWIIAIVANVATFVGPAALVVALQSVYQLASKP